MSDYKTISAGLCPGPCDSHDLYEPHPVEDEQVQGLLPLGPDEPRLRVHFFDADMFTGGWLHRRSP